MAEQNTFEKQETAATHLTSMVEGIARNLVDQPHEISLTWELRDEVICLSLSCAGEEVSKLIGRTGRTARSLRTILSAAAMKHGVRASLSIENTAPLNAKMKALETVDE